MGLSELAGGLGWLKATSLGGAEAGRGGEGLGAGPDLYADPRSREGGESKAASIIGVVGGVVWGVVGVAGWRTIMGLGETSGRVSWSSPWRLLGALVMSSLNMVGDAVRDYCEVFDTGTQGLRGHVRLARL